MSTSAQTLMDSDFVIAAPAAVTPEAPVAEVKPSFRREIDLGDGGGKQVFEAESQDALIDKLADAQKNATKKIRDQNRLLKLQKPVAEPVVEARYKAKPLTADQEFMVGQQFSQTPTKAFEVLFESVTGMKPEEFRSKAERIDAFDAASREQSAAVEFVTAHAEDYYPVPQNYAALKKILTAESLPMTKDNLEWAFEEAKTSGLLVAPQPAEERIATPPVAAPVKKASPLRDTSHAEVPTTQAGEPTAEELRNLPYEEARERIAQALYRQRSAPSQ